MGVINGIEEEVLVNRLTEGDKTAFELLFRFYYPGLVVFVRKIVANGADAEEIVQDFFVTLWMNRIKLHKDTSLKNYFFVAVKNRAFNYLKKKKIKEKVLEDWKGIIETDFLYQPDLYVQSDLQEQIKSAVNKLPDRMRQVFVLSRINGLSNNDIAEQLTISKRTVETHITNALKILREELKACFFLVLVLGLSGVC